MHKRIALVKMLLFVEFQYCTLICAFLLAGKFVAIHGTVVRVSNVKPLVMGMAFSCNLCGETQVWHACWTLKGFCYFGMKMLILFTPNDWWSTDASIWLLFCAICMQLKLPTQLELNFSHFVFMQNAFRRIGNFRRLSTFKSASEPLPFKLSLLMLVSLSLLA